MPFSTEGMHKSQTLLKIDLTPKLISKRAKRNFKEQYFKSMKLS